MSPETLAKTIWITLAAALVWCSGETSIHAAVDRASLTNFDRRISARKAFNPTQREAQTRLKQLVPGANVDFEPVLGSPKWVHGGGALLTGKNGEGHAVSKATAQRFDRDSHKALKGFLEEHRALFRHGPEALDDAVKKRDWTNTPSLRTTVWEQQVDGIPVFDSVFIAHTTGDGELISVSSQFVPEPKKAADRGTPNRIAKARAPAITAERALRLAAENVGEEISDLSVIDPEPGRKARGQQFKAKPLPGEASAALVWLPLDGDTLRLCWEVELNRQEFSERFRCVVDAETGEVLIRRKLTMELSEVFYRVYTSDSPSPMSPGHAVPTNIQPQYVPRVLLSISNLNGNASPLGWINDGGLETRGNNVDAHLDRDNDDRADLPRIQGTVTNWVQDGVTNSRRMFDFPIDFAQNASTYAPAAVVQLFYWCNFMHDKLYELGFTEAAGNFQKDNFGRGGDDNDPVMADAQDGSGFNNANYTPSREGSSPKIQMYVFNSPNPTRDGDLDAEVICHEYAHGLSDRLVGQGVGIVNLQSWGMGEGWSDFFAEALLSEYADDIGGNYAMGGYVTYQFSGLAQNYYYGIRRYPYSTNMNVSPLTFKDIDPLVASSHIGVPRNPIITGSGNEVHRQGEVWCSMLWDMRAYLLRKYAPTNATDFTNVNMRILRYVTLGMILSPANPNFEQARDAILQAVRFSDRPFDTNEVWKAFARRGLGLSAICPDSSTTFGAIEAFDTPSQPEFDVQPRVSISFNGPPGGPFSSNAFLTTLVSSSATNVPWSAGIELTNANNVKWLQLSTTNGVLASGIPFEVMASLTPEAATLPMGAYLGTVRFTNLLRTQVVARAVSLNIGTAEPPPDPLVITPMDVFSVRGTNGGPFFPWARTYQLANVGGEPLPWYAWTTNNWLSVTSSFGVLDPAPDINNIYVSVNTNANAFSNGLYSGAISVLNTNTSVIQHIPVLLRIGPVDHFVENFLSRPIDLESTSIMLIPDGSQNYYTACRELRTSFPTDPTNGIPLALADDQYRQITLTNDRQVSILGVSSNAIYIGANGNVTFDPGTTTNFFDPGIQEFFAHVRVAPLYADLNPAAGGSVLYEQLDDRFVVTWLNVPEFHPSNVNTNLNNVQVELFYDGRIRMTWLNVDVDTSTYAIVGLSPGAGLPEEFVQSDFSSYGECTPSGLLIVPSSVTEGDQIEVTVVLSDVATNDVEVMFTASDTNEVILIEPLLRIPAGTNRMFFTFGTFVDDGIPDGTQPVTITATFSDRPSASATIQINDAQQSSDLFVRIPRNAREGDVMPGAGRAVMLDSDWVNRTQPLTINLSSSDPGRVRVPSKVVIQPGTNAASFDLVFPENNLIEDTNSVEIRYSVPNWPEAAPATVYVGDNESHALALVLPAEVTENQGAIQNAGRVVFAGLTHSNVVITLSSEDPILSVPGTVTNVAGSSNVSFTITVLNNDVTNGFTNVAIFARAVGFSEARSEVSIIDDERPFEPVNPSPAHLATRVHRDTALTWSANSSAPPSTVYTVHFSRSPVLGENDRIAVTTEKTARVPYILDADTTYYWQVRAELAGFDPVSSPVWQFHTADVRYEFAPIASPQFAGEPFPLSVRARDEWGLLITNHTGQLTLTNFVPSRSSSSIVITELETTGLRSVEFANVSDRNINIAGWKIYLYDTIAWPAPAVAFTVPSPSVAGSGDLFVLRSLPPSFFPGTYPNFATGTNVAWSESPNNNPVAVLLVDNVGNIVDYVCASGANPSLISIPAQIPFDQWSGPPITANTDTSKTYQRTGNLDSNTTNDWRIAARSTRTNNVGLSVPFTNFTTAAFTATPLQIFRGGICTGSVTVLDPAFGLVLSATDAQGRAASADPIDVFVRNDVSLSVAPLDNASVGDLITYQFRVTNTGPSSATSVRLIDGVSSNAQFTAAAPSQGACVVTNNRVICDLGALGPESSATIAINALTLSRGTMTNFATVTRGDPDGYISNNTAVVVTTVAHPQAAIFNVATSESDVSGLINFAVTLSIPSAQTTSVAFATSDGTATAGIDYYMTNGVLTFPPGVTNQTIPVRILNDLISESNETFFVNLSSATNLDITRQMAVGTLTDDDPVPALTVADVTIVEPDNGTTNVIFNVRLSAASGRIVNVAYVTASGTALAGFDFEERYGTLVFQPGLTNLTVAVPVFGDVTPEPQKTFTLGLLNPGNAIIGRSPATATIVDNDVELVSSFSFGPIIGTNHSGLPTPVTITAQDATGAVATNFNGGAALFASTLPRSVTIGTNTTTWALPLAASFHDARLQSIYLSNELAGAGTIVGLSLDVVAPPAQILSNFTIRIRHTPKDRYALGEWEGSGWITNCQRDALIASAGWVYFPFSTPFTYNGRDNLMIDFSFDNSSFSADGLCRSTPTPTQRSYSLRTDSAYGRPLDWPLDGIGNRPTGQAGARVPNVRLLMGGTVGIQPLGTNLFANGVWSGIVTVTNGADNVVLRAVDNAGHFGESAPFTTVTLRLVNVTRTGSGVSLDFASVAGHRYMIETNSNPTALGWGAASSVISGDGTVLQFQHSPAVTPQFYRIRLVQ